MTLPEVLQKVRERCESKFGAELSVVEKEGTHYLISSQKRWVSAMMIPVVRNIVALTRNESGVLCTIYNKVVIEDVKMELLYAAIDATFETADEVSG